jgi:hypothetical protein
MSKLGIGLFYFALVGALCAAVFGFMLVQKYGTSQANLAQAQTATQKAQTATKAETAKADAAQQAADQATTQLTTAQGQVTDLNAKLATAQKAQAKADADKATAALKQITDVLGDMTADQMKAAMLKAQSDLTAAQSQQKILEDQLQASQKQIADLQDAINRSKVGAMPPGISGKVTFVNRAWNFVVLNVGISNGVVPNGELIVYRGRNFLGKVKVTSAEATTAVADILPNAKADIQVGDDVLN